MTKKLSLIGSMFLFLYLSLGVANASSPKKLYLYQVKIEAVFEAVRKNDPLTKRVIKMDNYVSRHASYIKNYIQFPKAIYMNNGSFEYKMKKGIAELYEIKKAGKKYKKGTPYIIKAQAFVFNINGYEFTTTSMKEGVRSIVYLIQKGDIKSLVK